MRSIYFEMYVELGIGRYDVKVACKRAAKIQEVGTKLRDMVTSTGYHNSSLFNKFNNMSGILEVGNV